MVILFSFLIFLLFAAGLSFAGMKLYVKPKEAIERVAGTGLEGHEVAPVHPSLVFHDIVKRLGALVPASPKDVTVMQRRLIRAGYRNPNALKVLYGAKLAFADRDHDRDNVRDNHEQRGGDREAVQEADPQDQDAEHP